MKKSKQQRLTLTLSQNISSKTKQNQSSIQFTHKLQHTKNMIEKERKNENQTQTLKNRISSFIKPPTAIMPIRSHSISYKNPIQYSPRQPYLAITQLNQPLKIIQQPKIIKQRCNSSYIRPQSIQIVKPLLRNQSVILKNQPLSQIRSNDYYFNEKPRNITQQNQYLKTALISSRNQNRRLMDQLVNLRGYISHSPIFQRKQILPPQCSPYFSLKNQPTTSQIIQKVEKHKQVSIKSMSQQQSLQSSRQISNSMLSELKLTSTIKPKDESCSKIQCVISKIQQGLKQIKQMSQASGFIMRNSQVKSARFCNNNQRFQ